MVLKKGIIVLVIFIMLFSNNIVYAEIPINLSSEGSGVHIKYSEFKALVESNKIEEVSYSDTSDTVNIKTKDGNLYNIDNPKYQDFRKYLVENDIKIISTGIPINNFYMNLLIISILAIFITMIIGRRRKAKEPQGSSVLADGGSDFEISTSTVRFSDVAGCAEAKENIEELVYFLKAPLKYENFGVKFPKGIIIYGPTGTGKTLLAKALAGEAGANFIAASGSEFVHKYVGVGAQRIRQLFKKARKMSPCIIFIDEIDAIGSARGGDNSNREYDQTLNQLLIEMDGFKSSEQVMVVAATNRLDILDIALKRPGRFDRHVHVNLPSVNDRYEILKVHSANKPLKEDVDLMNIAKQTTYMSGADLANVMNEAGIYAIKEDSEVITMAHINKAINKVVAGDEKKDRSGITKEEKERTAFHEAGHAVAAKLLTKESVPKISIIPTTKGAAGYTIINPQEKMFQTKKEIYDEISVLLAGRAVEEAIYGKDQVSGGAANDLERVTHLILNMITRYGMSEEAGLLSMDKNIFDAAGNDVVKEAKKIANEINDYTIHFVIENMTYIEKIKERLMENEIMMENELDSILHLN